MTLYFVAMCFSDGAGRTGTYCLIDMALNRLHKGNNNVSVDTVLVNTVSENLISKIL